MLLLAARLNVHPREARRAEQRHDNQDGDLDVEREGARVEEGDAGCHGQHGLQDGKGRTRVLLVNLWRKFMNRGASFKFGFL